MNAPITARRREELLSSRRPFVQVTVVRAEQPTSARPGDQAIVLEDGSLEGFIGGQCTLTSVQVAALRTLEERHSLLLRVLPEGGPDFPPATGAEVVVNPCLSGGAIELYLEPVLPAPVLHVDGDSPIARAVAELGAAAGFEVTGEDAPEGAVGASAVVVSRHGGTEAEDLRAALAAGAAYVGLVASPVRGSAVLDGLDLSDADRARIHTPAGLDIGAETPEEVALSILAEVVSVLRAGPADAPPARPAETSPATAVDPACGMTVAVTPDAIRLRVDGTDHYFCCPGCRDRYAAEHQAAAGG